VRPLERLAAKWAREREHRERERARQARSMQNEDESTLDEAAALEQLRREPDDDQPWGRS
jgi:hypothetical protein